MDITQYLNTLSAKGRYSFSLDEAIRVTEKSHKAISAALRRQVTQHRVALPYRGFYVIVPPTYQRYRCPPAEYWIDDFMRFMQQNYYVGLLSAAKYYAASHQKPQVFQVVIDKAMRSIQCGEVTVQFITSENINRVPTKQFNTPSGYLQVESAEALTIDLLRYPLRSGGINNIATIIAELAESIDEAKLINTIESMQVEQVLLQRLGYLLELVGEEEHASIIEKKLQTMTLRTRPLVNGISTKGCQRNERWDLYINYDVEPDL